MDVFEKAVAEAEKAVGGTFVSTIIRCTDTEVQGKPGKKILYETDVDEIRYWQNVGDFEKWDSKKTNFTRVQFLDALGWDSEEFPPNEWVEGSTVVITVKIQDGWENVTRVAPFNTGQGDSAHIIID